MGTVTEYRSYMMKLFTLSLCLFVSMTPSSSRTYYPKGAPATPGISYEPKPKLKQPVYQQPTAQPNYQPAPPTQAAYQPAPLPKQPAYQPAASVPKQTYQPAPEPHTKEPGMPYNYSWAVEDGTAGLNYGQNEASDGNVVTGEYRVLLPDGRTQIVRYRADHKTGYVADVTYEGEVIPYVPVKKVEEV